VGAAGGGGASAAAVAAATSFATSSPILANDSDADIRVATNVILHEEGHPSFLDLPVLR